MKKYILITAFAATVFAAKAQKLEKPEVDKITGAVSLSTKEEVVSNKLTLMGHKLSASITTGRDYCILYFHLRGGDDPHYYVAKGDSAFIKFANGQILTIKAMQTVVASWVHETNPPVFESYLPYYLSGDDVDQLMANKIEVIRVRTSKGDFDYDVNEKKSEVIKKQLALLAKK